MESKDLLRRQENMYWNSNFDDKIWYRKIFGGQWRRLKMGKDTPYIGMFCTWTKMGDECWSGYTEVLKTENYPITGVDTKLKFYKEFFKNIYKKIFKKNEKI